MIIYILGIFSEPKKDERIKESTLKRGVARDRLTRKHTHPHRLTKNL